jgi:hypothetical protein
MVLAVYAQRISRAGGAKGSTNQSNEVRIIQTNAVRRGVRYQELARRLRRRLGYRGFGAGTPFRPDLEAALASSPALPASALPLPFCFLAPIPAIFDFGRSDGICLSAANLPAVAEWALPLPSGFLTSISDIFDFRASSGFCLPATISSPVAESCLPLPPCFLTSISENFVRAGNDF